MNVVDKEKEYWWWPLRPQLRQSPFGPISSRPIQSHLISVHPLSPKEGHRLSNTASSYPPPVPEVMEDGSTSPQPSRGTPKSRGSHKPRGGFGKYLRARGRGAGRGRGGRPAEWGKRLVLENEQDVEIDEEEAKEMQAKYSRRQLGTNADRYKEPEPELDSDGEEVVEPEVDLSAFLERQRLSDEAQVVTQAPDDDDDVDTSLAHFSATPGTAASKKGKVQQIEWDASLDSLSREKAAADATRDLKSRFRTHVANTARQPIKPTLKSKEKTYTQAPELPSMTPQPPKNDKEKMEDFLDDLLG